MRSPVDNKFPYMRPSSTPRKQVQKRVMNVHVVYADQRGRHPRNAQRSGMQDQAGCRRSCIHCRRQRHQCCEADPRR